MRKIVLNILKIFDSLCDSHAMKKAEYFGKCTPLYVILKEDRVKYILYEYQVKGYLSL